MNLNKTTKEKEAVLNVFAAMLRPLMRLAFEYGLTAADISRTCRRAYIHALEARLSELKHPITEARIAVLAGLPRSDVNALRDTSGQHSTDNGLSPERISNVLTAWHTHSNFSGAYGIPLELDVIPRADSPRRSFKELVEVACFEGADDAALLDALITAKSVEIVDGTARCISRAYVTSSPDANRIEQVGRFTEAVISNFVHNLLRTDAEPKYFERAVFSEARLSEAGRDEFLAMACTKGEELLFELDSFLSGLDVSKTSETGKRYGLGMYFFEDLTSDRLGLGKEGVRKESLRSGNSPAGNTTTEPTEIDVLAALSGKKK